MMFRAAGLACLVVLSACGSSMPTTEPGGGYIANGESVLVNDGRCPAGQVNQVTGPKSLTSPRTYACVPMPRGGLF